MIVIVKTDCETDGALHATSTKLNKCESVAVGEAAMNRTIGHKIQDFAVKL